VLTNITPSVPAKRFPLESCSALIIGKFAPWLMLSSQHCNLTTPPFQICGSWVGVLPKLLHGGARDGILPSAVITLGLSIMCKDTRYSPPTSSCARAHCLALSLLRNSLTKAEGIFDAEQVAASMCLGLAEVRNFPRRKAGVVWLMNILFMIVSNANFQRRGCGTS
jgi:hypothetical protein